MLNVTDQAAATLHEATVDSNNEQESSYVLRLIEDSGSIGLQVGEQTDTDQVVEYGEDTVLAIDQQISATYDGCTLDVEASPEGTRLVLHPPSQ